MSRPQAITDREAFRAMASQGASRREMAEHFGVSEATVHRYRERLDIPWHDPRPFSNPDTRLKVTAAITDGWSLAEIHRTLGVHPETVRKHYPGAAWTMSQRDEIRAAERHAEEGVERTYALAPFRERQRSRRVSDAAQRAKHTNRKVEA